jgi:SPP1 family predicted phage head-tail adaptor
MQIGSLRHRVTLQERDGTSQDSFGQPVETWTDVALVWADIRYPSGLQTVLADAEVSVVKASIRIRRRASVYAGMRATCGGAMYEIDAVLPDPTGREYIDLACHVIDLETE